MAVRSPFNCASTFFRHSCRFGTGKGGVDGNIAATHPDRAYIIVEGDSLLLSNRRAPMPVIPINKALTTQIDRRDVPMYSVSEAGRFIGVGESTLRTWIGRNENVVHRTALIQSAGAGVEPLSFYNVVEAYVLRTTRQRGISLDRIRTALDYVAKHYSDNSLHPLLTPDFRTAGKDLFIDKLGPRVAASRGGQIAFREMVEKHLESIEVDLQGWPSRLFPLAGGGKVVLNPRVSSGRPVLTGTGVMASVLADRVLAGETVADLAKNYGVAESDVKAAIEYTKDPRAA